MAKSTQTTSVKTPRIAVMRLAQPMGRLLTNTGTIHAQSERKCVHAAVDLRVCLRNEIVVIRCGHRAAHNGARPRHVESGDAHRAVDLGRIVLRAA